MRVFTELVACDFDLTTAKIFRKFTCFCIHFFSNPLTSARRIDRKFHDLGNIRRMMQLCFKSQIQHASHSIFAFINKAVIMSVLDLVLIDLRKSIERKRMLLHFANQIVNFFTILECSFSIQVPVHLTLT